MPTENRSSNTEMVSVPRALAERISNICMFTMYKEDWRALSEILAQPAEQLQGEPVAWRGLNELGEVVTEWIDGAPPSSMVDLSGNPARFARIEQAYTHADPGEVERLKSTAEHFTGVSIKAAEEVSRLRAKLIELESSVREFLRIDGLSVDGSAARNKALKMLAATLSASAEPSAPVERDDEYDYRTDLAAYFGLSYASWLTLPRVLMEAMPKSWQAAMATLLHQYDDAYPNQPDLGTTVRVTENGKIVRTPEWLENYRHPDHAMLSQLRSEPGKSCNALARKPS